MQHRNRISKNANTNKSVVVMKLMQIGRLYLADNAFKVRNGCRANKL